MFAYFQDFPLNPKSLSLGELYGEFDINTNEWTDGVLSSVMRQTCAGPCQNPALTIMLTHFYIISGFDITVLNIRLATHLFNHLKSRWLQRI